MLAVDKFEQIRSLAREVRRGKGFLSVQDTIDIASQLGVTTWDVEQATTTVNHDHPQSCTCQRCHPRVADRLSARDLHCEYPRNGGY